MPSPIMTDCFSMNHPQNVNETLPILLKSLRLPHIKRQWQAFESKAAQQSWSYGQFLQALCEYEQQQRYTSRVERYLRESQLPRSKSLSNFDFAYCPSINQGLVLQLACLLCLVTPR